MDTSNTAKQPRHEISNTKETENKTENEENYTSDGCIELDEFIEKSPTDISPLAFFKIFASESPQERSIWDSSYESLYFQALKSQDDDIYQIGLRMKKHWDSDKEIIESYWSKLEQTSSLEQDSSENLQVHNEKKVLASITGAKLAISVLRKRFRWDWVRINTLFIKSK
ncbi:hypothetical protein BGZ46_004604 [Entomortierella lignicola]|nr:hypothetical protein BGZ46_004604 [Entomortierella lignicola]